MKCKIRFVSYKVFVYLATVNKLKQKYSDKLKTVNIKKYLYVWLLD